MIFRNKKRVCYHGRCEHLLVHYSKSGKKYVLVRKKGGDTRRLYNGSYYFTGREKKLLVL